MAQFEEGTVIRLRAFRRGPDGSQVPAEPIEERYEHVKLLITAKDLLDDVGDSYRVIPLAAEESLVRDVLTFCKDPTLHLVPPTDPERIVRPALTEAQTEFYRSYLIGYQDDKSKVTKIWSYIETADYLHCALALRTAAQYLAETFLRGKTKNEVRALFGQPPMTDEEEVHFERSFPLMFPERAKKEASQTIV